MKEINANQQSKPTKVNINYKLLTREEEPDDEAWAEMLKNRAPPTTEPPLPPPTRPLLLPVDQEVYLSRLRAAVNAQAKRTPITLLRLLDRVKLIALCQERGIECDANMGITNLRKILTEWKKKHGPYGPY